MTAHPPAARRAPRPLLPAALAALLLTGCAATLPADRVSPPREAIRAATELGASESPRASLHLKLAQDQVARADALLRVGDEERATWVLARADADAELAVLFAKQERARDEALQAAERVRDLKRRIRREDRVPGGVK